VTPLPHPGDVAWLDMSPTIGREQRGHRPYLVLSDARLHRARQLVIGVPLTTRNSPIPTRVAVGEGSYAIAEQPTTFSMERITRVEARGLDTAEVRRVIVRLLGG